MLVCVRRVYFPYDDYVLPSGQNGSVIWVHDKPGISLRDCMRNGHSTPQSTARMINALSRDHTSTDGYSILGLMIWDVTLDMVLQLVELLDDDVVLVKPDQLVQLMSQHVVRNA